ncbi:MAG: heme ABC exporter ATP-binding protein CcmA [Gammaproteobacteria bacterium]|nr:heme ABC exporter ATP-binding protein CcmA [Gammaproteobacteria bacterium]
MLSVEALNFDYPIQGLSPGTHALLEQVSFKLSNQEILHIQGANGSGKTTLLKCLTGLIRPDSGKIFYDGRDIWSDMTSYHQNISYLSYKNGINLALTVMEHCQFELPFIPEPDKIATVLRQLSLWQVRSYPCHLLSSGQQRRVALIHLFLSSSKLWLLDEPLIALDEAGVTLLISLLKEHLATGGQVVYTSHQALPWGSKSHREYTL